MKPFRRGRGMRAPDGGPARPDDDQWFRPAEPTVRPGPRRYRRKAASPPATGTPEIGAAATGPIARVRASPTTDAPTEAIDLPPNWLDDTTQLPRVVDAGAPPTGGGPPPPLAGRGGPGRKRRLLRRLTWTALAVFAASLIAILFGYSRIQIPDPNKSALRQTTRIYYSNGTEEIGRFGDVNRVAVTLDKVPKALRDAVLAAENRNFYADNGVSPRGIARALWVNLKGGAEQGGSTITQQYVKNYYLTPARTLKRKIREAMLSVKIDQKKSKDQILEDYLNTIYLGRGAYGVQAAARTYFGTDVSSLTPSQGILLASIIRAPTRYNPYTTVGVAALRARWSYVADAMVLTGTLDRAGRSALQFPEIPKLSQTDQRYGGQRGYILTAVRQELRDRGLSDDQIDNGGFRVVTTFDAIAQRAALNAVAKEFPKSKNKDLRVGLVAVEPGTGRVIAMYGGTDFLGKDKYAQVNAATYPIQPGSTMKVFTTAALLENGYHLDSTFDGNSPLQLPHSKPVRNEFNKSYGEVTLQRALDLSINTAFAQAAQKVGPARVRAVMEAAGIPHDTPGLANNARITLGIASVRAIYVADAIATLCDGGIHAEQHMVEKVLGPNGGLVPFRKTAVSEQPVIPPEVVATTIKAMQDVVTHGTGTAAKKLGRPVAGKTGTHQSLTAWFSGCTPQLAASVVYFKGDGTQSLDGTAGLSTFFGAVYPAATFTTFMKGALRGQPVENFKTRESPQVVTAPTANPYDTSSGFDPTATAPPLSPTSGPQFPVFDPGPNTYTPPPAKTPTPKASPKPPVGSTTAPLPPRCTDDPTRETETAPYAPDCSPDGQLPADSGGPPPAPGGR